MQLQQILVADRNLAIERLAGPAIIQRHLSGLIQPGLFKRIVDLQELVRRAFGE